MKVQVTFNLEDEQQAEALKDLVNKNAFLYKDGLWNVFQTIRKYRKYGFDNKDIAKLRAENKDDMQFAVAVVEYIEKECLSHVDSMPDLF